MVYLASWIKYENVAKVTQYLTTDPHHLGDDGEDSTVSIQKCISSTDADLED